MSDLSAVDKQLLGSLMMDLMSSAFNLPTEYEKKNIKNNRYYSINVSDSPLHSWDL